MNRDRPARTKSTGVEAAAAGAIVGAWLGFHATADLLALITVRAFELAGPGVATSTRDRGDARN